MPKLTIDGIEIEVEQGTSVIQAAEMLGIEIPRFCYHDRLSVAANCRMCLVEIKGGPPKPAASCAVACGEGMEVITNSEMVHKARKGVMEFLLINHPLDCPICDQGGECDLQDQAMAYGYDRTRYAESKRSVKDKELGPIVKTVMTRCIQCTRCVRFCEEIGGTNDLGLINRGEDVEVGPYIEKNLATELSGNLVDICPVGALTSKPYAFSARPWELRKTPSIDVLDAVGSNIRVDSRGGEVMRILPRLHEGINEEWISDKTRHAAPDGLKMRRLDKAYVKNAKGKLEASSWDDALTATAKKLTSVKGSEIGALTGDLSDCESIFALKSLMKGLKSGHMDCRVDGAVFDPTHKCGTIMNSSIEGIEDADAILLIGVNPRKDAAMVNARIRKAYVHNQTPVGLIGDIPDLNYPFETLGENVSDIDLFMKAKDGFAKRFKAAKKPMIIVGMAAFQREDGLAVHHKLYELAQKFKVVREGWNGFNVLHQAASRVGALELGFVPTKKSDLGFHGMIEAVQKGKIKALYLQNVDSFNIRNVFGDDVFIIYQGHHGDAGAHAADIILPSAAYTEKNGTYINTEGRVQQALKAVSPLGDAREDWTILRALAERCGVDLPFNNLVELRTHMQKSHKAFKTLDTLPDVAWEEFASAGKQIKIGDDPLINMITDFYQTDPISRASVTMGKCSDLNLMGTNNDMSDDDASVAAE